jgi:transcription termination factor NusB
MSQNQRKRNYKKKYQKAAKKNKLLAYGFSKDTSKEVPVETKQLDKLRYSWIPFGDDNLFPQQLSDLSRSASTHRAILNTKVTFTLGEGFHTLDEELNDYIMDVNANGESLDDVIRKLMSDYWTHGNAFLEIVKGPGYINLYHQDSTTARMHKDRKRVLFHPNWANVRKEEEKIKSVNLYPFFKKSNNKVERAVIHFSDYESTYYYYGLPDYVAALDHIKIANQIGKYNLTRFKNGFMPSAIIELGADMSEDEAQQFINEAREKLTGENNNSKILFIAKNGEDAASNVKVINDTSDGSFMELQTITNDNIISAHRWNPALSGIQVAGSLGNNQQILTIYDIVMSTVIKEPQQMIIRELKKILKREAGYNVSDLHIVNKPPVTLLGAINPTEYISTQEGRKIFHLPELTEEEMTQLLQEKNKLKDGINNSDTSNK